MLYVLCFFVCFYFCFFFFFSSRRRHTRFDCDWSSDVCSSDLCRAWLEQKRFGLTMLGVVLVFMIATVEVPTVQSILEAGAGRLPFDLANRSEERRVGKECRSRWWA